MKILDDLAARREAKAAENRKTLPPTLLKFMDEMRDVFGGVRLYRGARWPGGTNVKRPVK